MINKKHPEHATSMRPRKPSKKVQKLLDIIGKIKELKDGWAEGEGCCEDWGKAFPAKTLTSIQNKIRKYFPDTIPEPSLCPTPEGDLEITWLHRGIPGVRINPKSKKAYFSIGGILQKRTFHLKNNNSWIEFFDFLCKTMKNIKPLTITEKQDVMKNSPSGCLVHLTGEMIAEFERRSQDAENGMKTLSMDEALANVARSLGIRLKKSKAAKVSTQKRDMR